MFTRGQRLAEQAQLHGRRVAGGLVGLAAEQAAEQSELAHPPDQRPVDRAVHGRDVGEVAGHAAYPLQEVLLLRGEAEVGLGRLDSTRCAHAADHTGDAMLP